MHTPSRSKLFVSLTSSVLVALLSPLTACAPGDVDFDFAAELQVDLSDDDALATVDIELDFKAGQNAYAEASLRRVALFEHGESHKAVYGAEPLMELDLAFPESFDTNFEPGESRTVTLDNLGTLNSDFAALSPRCGELIDLMVEVEFETVDEPEPNETGMMLARELRLDCG